MSNPSPTTRLTRTRITPGARSAPDTAETRPEPRYARTGPRRVRTDEERRVFFTGFYIVLGLLMLVGILCDLEGPARTDGVGWIMAVPCLLLGGYVALAALLPLRRKLRLAEHGLYARARVVAVSQPAWSRALEILRSLLFFASTAAAVAEVGYRVSLEVRFADGRSRRLSRIFWRITAIDLPDQDEIVGVFFDPRRDNRFLLVSELDHAGIEVAAIRRS